MGAIYFAISGFAGLVGETGDFADPGDEIFRILIRAVCAVPVQPGIHILVPVLQAYGQVSEVTSISLSTGIECRHLISPYVEFCKAHAVI